MRTEDALALLYARGSKHGPVPGFDLLVHKFAPTSSLRFHQTNEHSGSRRVLECANW